MPGSTFRFADLGDVPLLAEANAQLIDDEGYEWKLSLEELTERWRGWIVGEYRAVVFEDESPAAYALYRPSERGVYLRQFFVWRHCRGKGIGRAAFEILRAQVWAPVAGVQLEVLCGNRAALEFWRALGFREHAIVMELPG